MLHSPQLLVYILPESSRATMLQVNGGALTTVGWVLWMKPLFCDLLEVIPGFIVGLILTIACSRQSPENTPERGPVA